MAMSAWRPEIYRPLALSSMACARSEPSADSRTAVHDKTTQETSMWNRRDLLQRSAALSALASLGLPRLAQAQLNGNAVIVSGFPAGGMGDNVARPVAERLRGRYATSTGGRKPHRRRRPHRGRVRQARRARRPDHPADPELADGAVPAHLQEAQLRPAGRLRAGVLHGDLRLLVHRRARPAGRDQDRGRLRASGPRPIPSSPPTACRRPARRCTSPA